MLKKASFYFSILILMSIQFNMVQVKSAQAVGAEFVAACNADLCVDTNFDGLNACRNQAMENQAGCLATYPKFEVRAIVYNPYPPEYYPDPHDFVGVCRWVSGAEDCTTYGNTSIFDINETYQVNVTTIETDLARIRAAGFNTIRTTEQVTRSFLEKAKAADLFVIAGYRVYETSINLNVTKYGQYVNTIRPLPTDLEAGGTIKSTAPYSALLMLAIGDGFNEKLYNVQVREPNEEKECYHPIDVQGPTGPEVTALKSWYAIADFMAIQGYNGQSNVRGYRPVMLVDQEIVYNGTNAYDVNNPDYGSLDGTFAGGSHVANQLNAIEVWGLKLRRDARLDDGATFFDYTSSEPALIFHGADAFLTDYPFPDDGDYIPSGQCDGLVGTEYDACVLLSERQQAFYVTTQTGLVHEFFDGGNSIGSVVHEYVDQFWSGKTSLNHPSDPGAATQESSGSCSEVFQPSMDAPDGFYNNEYFGFYQQDGTPRAVVTAYAENLNCLDQVPSQFYAGPENLRDCSVIVDGSTDPAAPTCCSRPTVFTDSRFPGNPALPTGDVCISECCPLDSYYVGPEITAPGGVSTDDGSASCDGVTFGCCDDAGLVITTQGNCQASCCPMPGDPEDFDKSIPTCDGVGSGCCRNLFEIYYEDEGIPGVVEGCQNLCCDTASPLKYYVGWQNGQGCSARGDITELGICCTDTDKFADPDVASCVKGCCPAEKYYAGEENTALCSASDPDAWGCCDDQANWKYDSRWGFCVPQDGGCCAVDEFFSGPQNSQSCHSGDATEYGCCEDPGKLVDRNYFDDYGCISGCCADTLNYAGPEIPGTADNGTKSCDGTFACCSNPNDVSLGGVCSPTCCPNPGDVLVEACAGSPVQGCCPEPTDCYNQDDAHPEYTGCQTMSCPEPDDNPTWRYYRGPQRGSTCTGNGRDEDFANCCSLGDDDYNDSRYPTYCMPFCCPQMTDDPDEIYYLGFESSSQSGGDPRCFGRSDESVCCDSQSKKVDYRYKDTLGCISGCCPLGDNYIGPENSHPTDGTWACCDDPSDVVQDGNCQDYFCHAGQKYVGPQSQNYQGDGTSACCPGNPPQGERWYVFDGHCQLEACPGEYYTGPGWHNCDGTWSCCPQYSQRSREGICAPRCGYDGGGCFLENTPVVMADGTQKPIQHIEVGDMVLSFDEESGQMQPDKVVHVFDHEQEEEFLIINDTLRVTPVHRVLSQGEWVSIGTLSVGDQLTGKSGKKIPIEKIEHVMEKVSIYNFEVNPSHTYTVGMGDDEIIVHNRKVIQSLDLFGQGDPP